VNQQDRDKIVREFARDGFCILRGHFSRQRLSTWRENFLPLLSEFTRLHNDPSYRGANRHYVTLPFQPPFSDPQIYEDPDILNITEHIVGKDMVMCQLATDTPLLGSNYQDIHCDAKPLFPETNLITPPFQIAVNFPLVDVDKSNGATEIARGTHMMSKAEGFKAIEEGKIKIEAVEMKLGDVMIRDVRGLHRGTPNRVSQPRPMVVIGYSRSWLHRPEVSIQIPKAEFAKLSERGRELLRFNQVVDELPRTVTKEIYKAFSY
jgi:hypothetical protein